MSELLPSVQAKDIRSGLLDYLTTTFALADEDAKRALREFLESSSTGIFKGPYVRLRLPFQPATDGWQDALEWRSVDFTPYGHQAEAFERLTSLGLTEENPRPKPTLVTTGTGSGKTEAFLYPILDHVRRARRDGVSGTKALILYPMNALANDQAKRLTELLTTDPELAGVTAAIYTGEQAGKRTKVSAKGLISDRAVIRSDPPDILLTNYKMLDQLLLRHDDQGIWAKSAHSLQYLVLDEFHTYDGAQGTDVAMLLRRLGLAIKSHWQPDEHTEAEWARPLGMITPIATSATLGDKADPRVMLDFASTVFGDEFEADGVVTESRMMLEEWVVGAAERVFTRGLEAHTVDTALVQSAVEHLNHVAGTAEAKELAAEVLGQLWGPEGAPIPSDAEGQLDLVKAHPWIQQLVEACPNAVALSDLAAALLPPVPPSGVDERTWKATREDFLVHVLAAISHVRAITGLERLPMLNVDLHMWVRELTRVDRRATSAASYAWTDDGAIDVTDDGDAFSEAHRPTYPAVYCRNCGRSGWGITLAPTGTDLDTDTENIRRKHATKEGRFRTLLHAPNEADRVAFAAKDQPVDVPELRYWHVQHGTLLPSAPAEDDEDLLNGWILPVLTHTGDDADDLSRGDTCPSCQHRDTIRFMGSAIATLLSVSLSTLFGASRLDNREKKALVFTDSVQDAAHRAGFVESRSHTLTLRSILMDSVPAESAVSLEELVELTLQKAGDDATARYRLLSPDLVEREEFKKFWTERTMRSVPQPVRERVRKRLLFDAVLEFGLQSHFGRTLELTGSVVAEVNAGRPERLVAIARKALEGADVQTLEGEAWRPTDRELLQWVRGVLVYMRHQGGIHHAWLDKYMAEDGNRWLIWGGRPKNSGMPAFPKGRSAPEFPRVGKAKNLTRDPLLVNVANSQSWYARWAKRALSVPTPSSASFARALFVELGKADVLKETAVDNGAIVYSIAASAVVVSRTTDEALARGDTLLACNVCRNVVPGTPELVNQLEGAPCIHARCLGALERQPTMTNYYREFYSTAAMRRIVAREHTGLLPDDLRLAYETGFKESGVRPDAPNVLVATPTLEMGIDIGDLSTVLLSSLPRSVASYLQRVGRAGRLTGNALNLAFVTGRGEQLPRLGDPLSVINGEVRPPATYLNAEEILQRQYIAHLVDTFARDSSRAHPSRADGALAKSTPGSFLGDLVAYAEKDSTDHLDQFLGTFATLSVAAIEALRAWATAADGPDSSGVAHLLHGASLRWRQTVDELEHRLKAIQKALPELQLLAASPAATEDQKRDFRVAGGSLKLTNGTLYRLRSDYWIAALEEFGILPNYTLLDDSVTLDVGLNWVDDAGQFQSEPVSYSRGARNALREFAPGATFYAGGLEIDIDAVDIGIDGNSIRTMAFCPGCGYAEDVSEGKTPVHVCPRCGNKGIADTSQHLDTLELTRVTAEIRRDEAAIGDGSDERKKPQFTMLTAADIDPQHVKRQWYVDGYDFGVRYLNRMTVRWVNLGKQGAQGQPVMISNNESQAAMFRLCEGCGKQDRNPGSNFAYDHRTWCRHRNDPKEHNRTLALTRTLETQGVVMRLPVSVTLGDSFALPSLTAAVLLGLREQLGGSPDHIQVATAVDPHYSTEDNYPAVALLLHDIVPGGTGYLADLADPDKVWALLHRSWEVVRDCSCASEDRLACHKCLLPFAAPQAVKHTSRAMAEKHLREILLSGEGHADAEVQTVLDWKTTEIPPDGVDTESHLEQAFRDVITKALLAAGAKVTPKVGTYGPRLAISVPGASRQWLIDPQVPMGGVQPDFVLSTNDTNVPRIAIFTDGQRFHASPSINRIADDAVKRAGLRADGHVVLAVTAADLDAWTSQKVQTAPWAAAKVTEALMARPGSQFGPGDVEAAQSGPIAFLLAWIANPRVTEHRSLADVTPYYLGATAGAVPFLIAEGASAPSVAMAVAAGEGLPPGVGAPNSWTWRTGALVTVSHVDAGGLIHISAVLDDRPEALEDPQHHYAWREWLRLSNALGHRLHPTTITALTATLASPGLAPSSFDSSVEAVLAEDWQAAIRLAASEVERALLVKLASAGVPLPEQGHELASGEPLDVCWPERRIVVDLGMDDGLRQLLRDDHWSVVDDSVEAITAKFAE